MVGGDGVHGAIGESRGECVAILGRSKPGVDFFTRGVLKLILRQPEVMGSDFASDRKALPLGSPSTPVQSAKRPHLRAERAVRGSCASPMRCRFLAACLASGAQP